MELNKITAAKSKNDPDYLTVKYITDGYDEFFRDPIFGNDEEIMRNFLSANPQNTNKNIVIQKIRLIDLLNSTHLQTHNKSGSDKIEVVLALKIMEMNFDKRIENGDPNLVDDIANAVKEVRLYSFASKYCHYHQAYALDKPNDDYPIYDTVLCETLPRYIKGVSKTGLANMFNPNYLSKDNKYEYKDYKNIIEKVLTLYIGGQYGNTAEFKGHPLRMLDRCLWFKNRHGGK